jgi:hypothetical protein
MRTTTERNERYVSIAPEYESPRLSAIIADGTHGYLETVRDVLDLHDSVDLIGRAANFEETIHQVVNLRPDLVLIDIEMPSAMLAIAAIITTGVDVQIVGMSNACIPLHAPGLILSLPALVDKARLSTNLLPLVHALYHLRQAIPVL